MKFLTDGLLAGLLVLLILPLSATAPESDKAIWEAYTFSLGRRRRCQWALMRVAARDIQAEIKSAAI